GRSSSLARRRSNLRRRSAAPAGRFVVPATSQLQWAPPQETQSRATSCCCRRPARATTSSATSKSVVRPLGGSSGSCGEEGAARIAPARARHAGPRRIRPGDGVQRHVGSGRSRAHRSHVVPEEAGRLRAHRCCADDVGIAISLVVVLLAVLLISGTPVPTLAAGTSIAVALGLIAIWFEPYRRARLFSFIDPWKDPQGAGFQTVQALISFGSGGFLGAGLGHGVAKINYLPEAHTDMIFAVIGEELGLLGVTAVIAAHCGFAYAGLRVALACKDPFGKRLAAGIVGLVCGQAVINLAAVLGLA